jgi:hypothetical protein
MANGNNFSVFAEDIRRRVIRKEKGSENRLERRARARLHKSL